MIVLIRCKTESNRQDILVSQIVSIRNTHLYLSPTHKFNMIKLTGPIKKIIKSSIPQSYGVKKSFGGKKSQDVFSAVLDKFKQVGN